MAKKSFIYNYAFSSEKVFLSKSVEKHAQIENCWQSKTILNKYVGVFLWEMTT